MPDMTAPAPPAALAAAIAEGLGYTPGLGAHKHFAEKIAQIIARHMPAPATDGEVEALAKSVEVGAAHIEDANRNRFGLVRDIYADDPGNCREAARLLRSLPALRDIEARVSTLFDAIAHGDDAHRDWLRSAIQKHFAGEPVPRVVGQGKAEEIAALRAECAALRSAAEGLDHFAWSAVRADCEEARQGLQGRIDRLRATLTTGHGESALRCVRELIGIAENTSGMTAEIEADIATARRLFGTGDSK